MKKTITNVVGLLLVLLFVGACSDYVQNVTDPISSVSDAELKDVADIIPFIRGMQTSFAAVHGEGSVNNGGLSDELFFSRNVPGATFPTYEQIDNGGITALVPGNNSVENAWRAITQLRYLADNLVTRCTEIKSGLDASSATYSTDSASAENGIYHGLFYGAVVRAMMADQYALVNTGPGGGVVVGNGPFVDATALHVQAQALLDAAILIAPTVANIAECNTLKARMFLFDGNYAAAAASAGQGMMVGADAISALCNEATRNAWFDAAGFGRDQFMADIRFKMYVDSDATESARIPLAIRIGNDGATEYWQQNKYTTFSSPIVYLSWQENNLILAECAIRNNDNPGALDFINAIRADYGITPMSNATVQKDFNGDYLKMLYVERDKQLCFTGLRGPDQIRFGKWHKPDLTVVWMWMPISMSERTGNPNFD